MPGKNIYERLRITKCISIENSLINTYESQSAKVLALANGNVSLKTIPKITTRHVIESQVRLRCGLEHFHVYL